MAGGASSDHSDTEGAGAATPGSADGLRTTAGAYAELVRVPNLFTAPPDVILGASLAAVADIGVESSLLRVGGLAVASALLYAGGTTLNDAFDAPADARERPERPIPSGRVSRRAAFGLGTGFLLAAVGLAFVVAGVPAAVAAGLIAAAIVAYDGLLKGSAGGFLAMGATRGLNVVLGTTAAGGVVLEFPLRSLAVPVVVTGYVAAVTFMAARETEGENRGAVAVAAGGAIAAAFVVGWYLMVVEPPRLEAALALAFAAAFGWWVGRPLRAAYADPVPETVGPAVGACVLGLALLDAAFASAVGVGWGFTAGAFLLPAVGLARVFDVT
ncbi:UbiA family prenyltransferase [Natrinema sp. 74]|uniref:UbiA family prenyltransferase n=1 Tax=Natrinema sp. 74 TaxID=3384159 RepID=UPI0038D46671